MGEGERSGWCFQQDGDSVGLGVLRVASRVGFWLGVLLVVGTL
jgi:hypothetical protein